MNLNLSKSELNLLLSQLQQRLGELNTNGIDQVMPIKLSKSTGQKSIQSQQKSTSMYNLDLVDNNNDKYPNSQSHLFHNSSKVANGKSLSNLIHDESELLDQNEIYRHIASMSNSPLNTQTNSVSFNNSARNANFQPRSYRRFVHNANPNFSIESFLNKKQQALIYREQLDRQVEEKQQKQQQKSMLEKIKEAMLDKKINEQQKHLKEEFDADHHFDKDHPNDRAIIESDVIKNKTESLPLISNTKHATTNHKSLKSNHHENSHNMKSALFESKTATLTHTNTNKSNDGNLNHKIHNVNSPIVTSPASNCRNACTQTDDSLLLNLIHDFMASETINRSAKASSEKKIAKTTTKSVPSVQTKNSSRRSNLNHSSNGKSTVYRK